MWISTQPFKVKCVRPFRKEEQGGIPEGAVATVRGIEVAGAYNNIQVFFLVFNPTRNAFMIEEAAQFEEIKEQPHLMIPTKRKE